MARVIEFYVPGNFRRSATWIPPTQRGKGHSVSGTAEEVSVRREASRESIIRKERE